jgi:hypothetical protein
LQKDVPATECLKDTVDRFLPWWNNVAAPTIKSGKKVISPPKTLDEAFCFSSLNPPPNPLAGYLPRRQSSTPYLARHVINHVVPDIRGCLRPNERVTFFNHVVPDIRNHAVLPKLFFRFHGGTL